MNIKFHIICTVIVIALATSSCGMKRALTLPKESENPNFSEDLKSHQSIDVLKISEKA